MFTHPDRISQLARQRHATCWQRPASRRCPSARPPLIDDPALLSRDTRRLATALARASAAGTKAPAAS
jgi:hypothetical protein